METAENLLDKDCVTLTCKVARVCDYVALCLYYYTAIPQLTLWVGTAGGSLGVFTVTRNKDGEPLQLVKTGKHMYMIHVSFYVWCFACNQLRGRQAD